MTTNRVLPGTVGWYNPYVTIPQDARTSTNTRQRISLKVAILWLCAASAVLPAFLPAGDPDMPRRPENLAPKAKITANSEFSSSYRAKFVADGKIAPAGGQNDAGNAWAVNGQTHKNGATLTFEWPEPVTVAVIVYYGRTSHAVECWKDCEVYLDGQKKPAGKGRFKPGHGPQRLKLDKPAKARKVMLKFTSAHFGLNPGASEVQVYRADPPDSLLGKFTPMPPLRPGSGRRAPAPKSNIKESPELAADLKAGKLGFRKMLAIKRHAYNLSHVYVYHAESYVPGGGMYIFDPAATNPAQRLKELVPSPTGEIMDCNLSFDGKQVLFSWKKYDVSPGEQFRRNYLKGPDPSPKTKYQIYRINIDGTGLTQLTTHNSNNFNPCWLGDGGIAFLSDRKPAFAYCFVTTSPVMHRMDFDGDNVQCLSANYLNDFTPSVLNDGRIIYTRWEYVDRPAIPIQSLWTMNPDGTSVSGFFGNRVLDPGTFMEARSISDTRKVLCVLTSHNGSCRGGIGIIDPSRGANAQEAIRNVTPEVNIRRVDRGNGNGVHGPYENPYPIDEEYFLVSRLGTVLLRDYDATRQVTLLRPEGGMGFYSPQPLRARKEPRLIASKLPERADNWATVVMHDVYNGLEPHVKRGEVKQIAVVQEVAKPNWSPLVNQVPTCKQYAANSAFGFQFPLISCGATYAAKRIWGYAEVEEDGSANFRVPAGLPIYFLALDAEGRTVQRMRTFTHFMPGEVQSCVGCHADRNYATAHGGPRPTAALRKSHPLKPPEWGEGNFSYSRVVQPVLDKHCIKCHNARKHPRGVDLTGDKTDFFSVSYDILARKGTDGELRPERHGGRQCFSPYTNWISTINGAESNILQITPRAWGSPRSKLADIVLSGHRDKDGKPRVNVDRAGRRRIMAWIDLNVPYYHTASSAYVYRMGCRRMLPPDLGRAVQQVALRRCVSCHKKDNRGQARIPRTFYTRITNIEHNSFLLAPLAKSAGGTEACGKAVFESKDDPDYRAILKVFEPIQKMLEAKPRMDMADAVASAGICENVRQDRSAAAHFLLPTSRAR